MVKNKQRKTINWMGVGRLLIIGLSILLGLLLLFEQISDLRERSWYLYLSLEIFSIAFAIFLTNQRRNPAYVIAWITVIIVLPVFGVCLYLLWGRQNKFKRLRKSMIHIEKRFLEEMPDQDHVLQELFQACPEQKKTASYLSNKGFKLYRNTACTYYPLGEGQFSAMLEDMEKAEKYIFLEYFILKAGDLWSQIEGLLIRKARAGVEVRLMYDDFGSIFTAPHLLNRRLRAEGIHVLAFNPLRHFFSGLYYNYRNHQKVTIIDGRIGYTGGTNLADEYVNLIDPHGHWKDTAIRLEGDAVWGFCQIFFTMWELQGKTRLDYEKYYPLNLKGNWNNERALIPAAQQGGYFAPYAGGPQHNSYNPAEVVYLQAIFSAKNYLYITTPYLVVDYSMTSALCTSAQSGVDVRIILPKQWDHWYVNMVSRANYNRLLEAGVRIFEYSPGFIHAKTMLIDGKAGITGSINLDFRSLYLHFENAVWICQDPILKNIEQDYLATEAVSKEITMAIWAKRPLRHKVLEPIFKLFAPLF